MRRKKLRPLCASGYICSQNEEFPGLKKFLLAEFANLGDAFA